MSRRFMHQSVTQRQAVSLALMAMIMMFAGPLISQTRLVGTEEHQGHRSAAMTHSVMMSAAMASEHHQANVFKWFDQCGYCSLWQHFPATPPDHLPLLRDHGKPPSLVVMHTLRGMATAPVFPHALSRAPPMFS
ncbi:Protein of unknown function [Kushneria avicenniae]|uniref:DUF2946 domain-containing protein n=1 Tax=Kushneria avicenniae TaxID=402385 RepID=A0A1I1LM38_9GAMM|nr:DUF2946 domain-containing protein [Kushneria avicenniae]SFC74016.1 Protein of unknown function [Kushneria avicenniae]